MEHKHLAMIEKLTAHQGLFKPIIVIDAGIATEANLQWLREKEYRYIVSARQDAPSIELEGEFPNFIAISAVWAVKLGLSTESATQSEYIYPLTFSS